jgi:Family of unknown function (DUF6082)
MMPLVLARRSVLTVFIFLVLMAIVGLVILSPLALAEIARFRSDWSQLSNIGQTYGAISAILSALALGGILISLQYQARDSRNSHEQITRTFQFDLIKLELEDPSLMEALGAPWGLDIPSDNVSLREFLYVQMWVSFIAGRYVAGDTPESTVRQWAAFELFRGRAGRTYWEAAGPRQIMNSKGRSNSFFRLLDDEYKRALSSGVPVVGSTKIDTAPSAPRGTAEVHTKSLERIFIAVTAAIIGILAGRLWRRKK